MRSANETARPKYAPNEWMKIDPPIFDFHIFIIDDLWVIFYFKSIVKFINSCRFFLSHLHLRFVKECNLSNYLHRTMLFPQLQWRIIAMDLFFRVLLQKWLIQLQQQILLQVYCMWKEYGKTASYFTSAHDKFQFLTNKSIVRNLYKPEPSDMNGHCLMLHI